MKKEAFLYQVVSECIKNNITFTISNSRLVYSNSEDKEFSCAGYFDAIEKTLAVGGIGPNWFEILIHEYSHLQQWKEGLFLGDKEWLKQQVLFWEWLEGKNIRKCRLTESIRAVATCEIDCENRSVKTLSKIRGSRRRIRPYIQEANVCLYYYGIVEETRKWYKTFPYNNRQLISQVPPNRILTIDEVLNPPKNVRELIKRLIG